MRIKTTLTIIILFIFCNAFSQLALTYKNTIHNYTINLPKNLEIEERPSKENPDTLVATSKTGARIYIFAKADPAFKGVNGSQLIPNTFMPAFRLKYKEATLTENDYTDIGGEPALYMKVEYKSEEEEGVIAQFILIRSGKLYTIRIVSPKESYDKFISEITGFIMTFQFIDTSVMGIYRNDLYSFVIKFPSGWPFDKNSFPVQANSSKGSSLYIEAIKNNEFAGVSAYDLDEIELTAAIASRFSSITLAGKKKMNIDGYPVLYVKYKWIQTLGNTKETFFIIHYYLIKKGVLFVIQGIVKTANSTADEKLIQESAESFQFLR